MHFFNHYSAPIVAALLWAIGFSIIIRHGRPTRAGLILAGVMVAVVAAWVPLRPVASPTGSRIDQPMLLEMQSPYCLGCVAIKPAVDRLEKEWHEKLVVRRVNIQSAEGRKLMTQYQIEFTPTFIFFDAAGRERWRSVGELDAARVRASL